MTMLWLASVLWALFAGYLLAERMVGIKVLVEHTVYVGQPNIKVWNVNVQRGVV